MDRMERSPRNVLEQKKNLSPNKVQVVASLLYLLESLVERNDEGVSHGLLHQNLCYTRTMIITMTLKCIGMSANERMSLCQL